MSKIKKGKGYTISKNDIDWYDHYEHLRTMHSHLKFLMNELVAGIPHFAGDPKALPSEYSKKLEKINMALYVAEKYVSRKMI
jgi:hypothetical protein